MSSPDLAELRDTVARMESRLRSQNEQAARRLLATYSALSDRFAADLADERDVLLARSAALMLAQELLASSERHERK